jgi:periplasmic protein TonB
MVRRVCVGTAMNLSATRTSLLLALSLFATGAAVPSTPPVPISSHEVTAADYPVESVAAREVGTTRVDYLVLADGTVADTMITQSSGSPRLDQAAIMIVSRWRFQPATENGRPVPARLFANVVFQLN